MQTVNKILQKCQKPGSSILRLVSPSPRKHKRVSRLSKPLFKESPSETRHSWLRDVNKKTFFGGFGGAQSQSSVDNQKLYDILGCKKSDDARAIKRAYLKQVKENHPDKGGDTEKFKEINAAYEVLGDEKKRQMYDQYGMEGMQNEMGGMPGMEDIFETFFGGRAQGAGPRRRQKRKMPTVVREMAVDLKDLYDGAVRTITFNREEVCLTCDGKGGKNVRVCGTCNGSGVVTRMVQMGPGMYSQTQSPCGTCHGRGEIIQPEDICKTCHGARTIHKPTKIEVHIPKGAPNGFYINFQGQGNQDPDHHPGDFVVKLVPKKHHTFQKKGSDLYMKQKVSLFEALSGFKFNVTKVDGTKVTIKTEPGEVIQHKQYKKVSGLGLPIFNQNTRFGDLYIEFLIEYPTQLEEEQKEKLKDILPKPLITNFEETEKSYQMKPASMPELEIVDEQYEERADDHHEGGQHVDCNSQ